MVLLRLHHFCWGCAPRDALAGLAPHPRGGLPRERAAGAASAVGGQLAGPRRAAPLSSFKGWTPPPL
eukprot:10806267-Alexandrium_andersonii.AAC.1